MAFIFYGTNSLALGVDEFLLKCPCCEKHSWADVMVPSKYFHVYGLPIGPLDKPAIIICKECGLRRQNSFDENLVSNYKEVKNHFRHPLFVYTGIGLVAMFVLSILYAIIVG